MTETGMTPVPTRRLHDDIPRDLAHPRRESALSVGAWVGVVTGAVLMAINLALLAIVIAAQP